MTEKWSLADFDDPKKVQDFVGQQNLSEAFTTPIPQGEQKSIPGLTVSPSDPINPDLSDLARLYFLCEARNVSSVIELGAGYSTGILGLAMKRMSQKIAEEVLVERRIERPFTVHTIEESSEWAEIALSRLNPKLSDHVSMEVSEVKVSLFNGRFATHYSTSAIGASDFYVIDGPSQDAPSEPFSGFSTAMPHLMPMSADVLRVEHFFEPGALIYLDGRTANARFIASNLQRNWVHFHNQSSDYHLFELQEEPLGKLNSLRLERLGNWLIPA